MCFAAVKGLCPLKSRKPFEKGLDPKLVPVTGVRCFAAAKGLCPLKSRKPFEKGLILNLFPF